MTTRQSSKITTTCKTCGKSFSVPACRIRSGYGKFCSRKCHNAADYPFADTIRNHSSLPTATGCILWTGSTHKHGYGRITRRGKHFLAHRIAWVVANGPITDGLHVCHNCPGGDNPLCINVAHLFLGTNADNVADMVKKDRQNRGARNGKSKLTDAQVIEIRQRYASEKVTHGILAAEYGVCSSMICLIINHKNWRHLA